MKIEKVKNRWQIQTGKRTVSSPNLWHAVRCFILGCFAFCFVTVAFSQGDSTARHARPWVYHSLEGLYIAVNAADLYTTFKVIDSGGYEANPIFRNIIHNRPLTIGLKMGITVGQLALLRLLRRDYPKWAYGLLIGLNAMYCGVVAHNYTVYLRIR